MSTSSGDESNALYTSPPVTHLSVSDLEKFSQLGVSPSLLARAGVRRVSDAEAREAYGITGIGNMSGIIFPYFDPRNGLRNTARLRRDHPEIEDGKLRRKYVSPYGDRRHLYFPPGSSDLFSDPSVPIVLVEAEKSSLALAAFSSRQERKLLAVAMGGCWGWRGRIGKTEDPKGERVDQLGALPDLSICRDGRKTYVLLDANVTVNPTVQQAQCALARQVMQQNADVYIAALPTMDSVNGPDDLIAMAGDAAIASVLDAARQYDPETNFGRKKTKESSSEKLTARDLLLELVRDIEFFHTPEQEPFASFPINGHIETWHVRSARFSQLLRHRFYRCTRGAPPKQAMEDAISVCMSRAQFDGPELPVFLRTAEHDGRVYIDLADSAWKLVELSEEGWKVVLTSSSPKFRRTSGMRALPPPVGGGDLGDLRSFLNVRDHEWPLLLTWLLAAYRDKGPYPILSLNGEQGSSKSTTTTVIRNLIDPNIAILRSEPKDVRDLFISANNSRVIALDNLSHIPDWLSDCLCRLSTGGGFATRQLYSDLDETIIDVQRPIILNGISQLGTRGDLLERSLLITLPTIPENRRRDEREFWSEFEKAKPELLGALFKVLAAALKQLPHVNLEYKPRMADFASFGAAVERAVAWQPGTFMRAYDANRQGASYSALESSPVGISVLALAAEVPSLETTASELLKTLSRYAESTNHRSWPASAWMLSNLLRRLTPNLRSCGVEVTFDRESSRKRTRFIRIRSITSSASEASKASETRRAALNQRTRSDEVDAVADAVSHGPQCVKAAVSDVPDAADTGVQSSLLRGEL